VGVTEIARDALGFDGVGKVRTADQRRISGILLSLGWTPGRDDKGRYYKAPWGMTHDAHDALPFRGQRARRIRRLRPKSQSAIVMSTAAASRR